MLNEINLSLERASGQNYCIYKLYRIRFSVVDEEMKKWMNDLDKIVPVAKDSFVCLFVSVRIEPYCNCRHMIRI